MDNLDFKEWFSFNPPSSQDDTSDFEIVNMYFRNPSLKIREIAEKTKKSTGEIYRILHEFGRPNRQNSNHETVISYKNAGFPISKIAEFTGYTPRNVRYIIKKHEGK